MEILDITDEEAQKYLMDNGMPERLAKPVVEHIGGRFIFLVNGIDPLYHNAWFQ